MHHTRRSDDPSTTAKMIERRKTSRTDAEAHDAAIAAHSDYLGLMQDAFDAVYEARWLRQAEPECAALLSRAMRRST